MELMTIAEQQDQQQRSQGFFTMPEAPTLQEQYDAIDRAFQTDDMFERYGEGPGTCPCC